MNEYTFKSMEELNEFLENRKNDNEKHYYFGDIDCMDDELYTIDDIKNEADSSWFENGAESSVFEFGINEFYAVLSERNMDSDLEVFDNAKAAIAQAETNWNYLTDSEKKNSHESAIVAWCYLESQIIESYNPIWEDGSFVDAGEYEKCSSYNEKARLTAEIIRKCQNEK